MSRFYFITFACLITAVAAWAQDTAVAKETKEFDPQGITQIEVANPSGKINIEALESGNVKVTAEKKKFGQFCELKIEQTGKKLNVLVKRTGFFKPDCEVDLTIKAPKTAGLDLDTGSGDITVKGTKGDLNFDVGSGNVNVEAEIHKLKGDTGSGNVSIKGLTKGGELDVGSGNLSLTFTTAPTTGTLKINAGSGSAIIALPTTTKYYTVFSAGSGKLTTELAETPKSNFKISMDSGSGDLTIKKQ